MEEIPLFELPLAILPGQQVPLHIFEDRYKRMICDCRESGRPFGIVLRTEAGPREIGCTAALSEIVEEFEDGRIDVIVTGGGRFRVLARSQGPDYPLATVEPLSERAERGDAGAARRALAELLAELGIEGTPREGDAFALASGVELPVSAKQELLEAGGEAERLALLASAFADLMRRMRRARELARRAAGNGHAPYGGPMSE